MNAEKLIKLMSSSFKVFEKMGEQYQDPDGVDAIREVQARMVSDIEAVGDDVSRDELSRFCQEWRALRIDPTGKPEYPPDMFIESICQAIEVS